MKITVIRHAKVNYVFPKKCDPDGLLRSCDQYDLSPIIESGVEPIHTEDKVFISTLSRSAKTARLLFGDRSFARSAFFDEVRIAPFTRRKIRLHSYTWDVMARVCWALRCGRQPEYRKKTQERANKAIDLIESYGQDAYVISHAFFMHTLFRQLKKRGYQSKIRGLRIKNLQSFEFIKK